MTQATVNLRDAHAVIDLFQRAAEALRSSPVRSGCIVRLPGRGRLLVTGDLHDNPLHLQKIVRLARLDQSPEHHVILHEMIHGDKLLNGMDFSHRMLARAAELMLQYPGQVHPLLANHELSQMTGAGVSKGAGNSVVLFEDALAFVFGDECEAVAEAIRTFIAAMPLALLSESGVLCAHSLPADRMMKYFDMNIIHRELTDEDYRSPVGSAYLMVWGRGHTPEQLEQIAEAWNVKLFCLGHEHVETGVEMRGPKLLVLNSDHERGAVLPLDLANVPEPAEALMYAVPLAAVGTG